MKIFPLLALATFSLLATAAREARAECTSKASCAKTIGCDAGFGLHAEDSDTFVCKKTTTSTQTATPACAKGTLKVKEGGDLCQWHTTEMPFCGPHNTMNDWEFKPNYPVEGGTKGLCVRTKTNGDKVTSDDNIKCTSGAYDDDSRRCEDDVAVAAGGTVNLVVACVALSSSTYKQNHEGNKDQCVKTSEVIVYAMPKWI